MSDAPALVDTQTAATPSATSGTAALTPASMLHDARRELVAAWYAALDGVAQRRNASAYGVAGGSFVFGVVATTLVASVLRWRATRDASTTTRRI